MMDGYLCNLQCKIFQSGFPGNLLWKFFQSGFPHIAIKKILQTSNSQSLPNRILLAGFLCTTVLLLSNSSAWANRSFSISDATISAEIRSDGTVFMNEQRTYDFRGSFSWVEQDILKEGFSDMYRITMYLNGEPMVFTHGDDAGPGTYEVFETPDRIIVRANFEVENESIVLGLTYILEDAIASDGEWAEFYWTFVGADTDVSQQNVKISTGFEDPPSDRDINAWTRFLVNNRPQRPEISDGTVTFGPVNVGSRRSLSLRTVFPSEAVDRTVATDVQLAPDHIESEFLEWMDEREQREVWRQERRAFWGPIATFLILLSILLTWLHVRKPGRWKDLARDVPDTLPEPPSAHRNSSQKASGFSSGSSNISPGASSISTAPSSVSPGSSGVTDAPSGLPPAMVAVLAYLKGQAGMFITPTILDLSRRGYLAIQSRTVEKKSLFGSKESETMMLQRTEKEPGSELRPWEKKLLEYLECRLDNSSRDIRKLFVHSKALEQWARNWSKMVLQDAEDIGLLRKNSRAVPFGVFQFALLAFSFYLFFGAEVYGQAFFMLVASLAGIFFAYATTRICTDEGWRTRLQWQAYGNGMRKGDISPDRMHTADHIIYSMIFHVKPEKIEHLIPDDPLGNMNWFYDPHRRDLTHRHFFRNMHKLGTESTNIISSATGSASGGGGAGGGRSGGGGGVRAG